jgi:hypothetical protein
MEAGLIDLQWQPLGWDNRQYASDSSAERTREWRERQQRLGDVTVTDQIQIQKQSKQNKKTRPQKRCPEDFVLTDALKVWASQKTPSVNIEAETERFRDYEFHTAHCDWEATWREWMRKALDKKGGSSGTSRQVGKPRLSSVERVRLANERFLSESEDQGGGGVVIDG